LVAKHVLLLSHDVNYAETGSGDTTYDWIQTLCSLVIAFVAALIWSALDRRRLNYDRLHPWLRLYLRLHIGAILIVYGSGQGHSEPVPATEPR
jgi:hypothetical protein